MRNGAGVSLKARGERTATVYSSDVQAVFAYPVSGRVQELRYLSGGGI